MRPSSRSQEKYVVSELGATAEYMKWTVRGTHWAAMLVAASVAGDTAPADAAIKWLTTTNVAIREAAFMLT